MEGFGRGRWGLVVIRWREGDDGGFRGLDDEGIRSVRLSSGG